LGGCDAGVSSMTITNLNPTSGLHRGGVNLSIDGTGFEAGATVRVGGATCTDVHVNSSISITCTTPETPMKLVDVVVRDTKGAITPLLNAYKAFAMIYVVVDEGAVPSIKVLKHDPVAGVSLLNTHTTSPSFRTGLLHPSGKWFLTFDESGGKVTSWPVSSSTGDVVEGFENSIALANSGAWSANGQFLYVGETGGNVYVCPYDLSTGACQPVAVPEYAIGGSGSLHEIGTLPGVNAVFGRVGTGGTFEIRRLTIGGSGEILSNPVAASAPFSFDVLFYNPVLPKIMAHQPSPAMEFVPFTSDSDGALTQALGPATSALDNLTDSAFTRDGSGLYIMSPGPPPTLRFYTYGDGGKIGDKKSEFQTEGSQSIFATDWYGKYLYLMQGGSTPVVSTYAIEPETGIPAVAVVPDDLSIGSGVTVFDAVYN